jgi:O-antigen/teichoic acid export membrane protein
VVMSSSVSQTIKTQLLRNALFSSGSWGAIVVVNLAAIPLFIRYLGVEGYGIYLLLTGLFGYFGLLDFGLSDGVVKYVAHHTELGNDESVTHSVNAALLAQVIGGVIGIFVLCTFNQRIIHALRVSPSLVHVASIGLYVSAAGFLSKMLLNTYNAALKGLQRFDLLAKTTVGFSLATTIAVVFVLFAGGGLVEVVVATASMTTANLVVVLYLVHRCIPQYRLALEFRREHFRALFGFSAYTFISRIAAAVNTYFLQVVIAVILGAGAVAYFAVPLRVTSALEAGMASLVSVIFPLVSTFKARENLASLQKLYSSASRYVVALSTPPYLFMILFSKQILRVWVGPLFAEKSWLVLVFLAGNSLFAAWTMVPANTAFGTGNTRATAAFSLVVTGLNLLFSIVFTLKFGITGTAAAVLVTAAQAPIFIWYVTSRVVRVSPKEYFSRVFGFHILPVVCFSFLSVGILLSTEAQNERGLLLALASGVTLTVIYYSLLLKFRVVTIGRLGWSA